MPRQLESVLDRLEQDPAYAEDEAFVRYSHAFYIWAELGVVVDERTLRRVRALWGSRIDLRPALRNLVDAYPCDVFEGLFCKHAAQGEVVDFIGWFRRYPRLQGQLRSAIVARAQRFNDPFVAVHAGLVWARYFEGADDAYRAVALAINRRDRCWKKKPELRDHEDFLRHDLQDHGTITYAEAVRVNAHLAALGTWPLDLEWIGAAGWWKADEPDTWRIPYQLGRLFVSAIGASAGVAASWCAEDLAVYAAVWRGLSTRARVGAIGARTELLDEVVLAA